MTLLLDTHVFLWWLSNPKLLTPAASTAIGDPQNRVLVSIAVLWEIAIKRVIGKLTAPIDLQRDVGRAGFELLPIEAVHVEKTGQLPMHHRDPFDRMLVASAGSFRSSFRSPYYATPEAALCSWLNVPVLHFHLRATFWTINLIPSRAASRSELRPPRCVPPRGHCRR